jgi:hypothetical protein
VAQPLYMPALKWKQGEQLAASLLTGSQKAKLQPLADLPDRPFDWKNNKYTKSWDRHLDDIVTATVTHWGLNDEIAFDQVIEETDSLSANTGTPWEYLFAKLWAASVKAIPVLSTRASASEQAALIQVAKSHKHTRWALRYRCNPHGSLPGASQVTTWLENAVAALGAKHMQVDAVLDLGHVSALDKSLVANTAQVLQAIADMGSWRQVGLLSGAFPINLAGIQKGTRQIARLDWELFKRVSSRPELESTEISYGDYGIAHVDAFDDDPRKMVMSANLRYTHWKEWHVIKGRSVRDYGYAQYKDLCKILVALPIFCGAPFSPGDKNYEKLATDPKAGPGNATQWRRDATNHHVHVVLHQLANQPEF